MKKWMTLTLTLFSLLALPACGGQAEPKNVDLTEVYASMEEVCDWWTGGYMEDVPEEALELYYPGLSALEPVQLIARTPLMSSVVNEVVLVECKSEEDADKAQEIFSGHWPDAELSVLPGGQPVYYYIISISFCRCQTQAYDEEAD